MGLTSTARYNSALTAQAYKLVATDHLELLDTGYWAMVGTCGHRLRVLPRWEEAPVKARMAAVTAGTAKAPRKRCEDCVQDPEAHRALLILGR